MCGIIGFASIENEVNVKNFKEMRDSMNHRGPDGEGSLFFEKNHVALGHRRLSIIDLSEKSSQPMSTADNKVSITFNGEIYNYKELKKELSYKYKFQSTGDTEVLLNGYLEWGLEKLVKKTNGMFAFGIWDSNTQKLHIARDRVGIKPLYYYLNNKKFIFSSELKGILKYSRFKKKINKKGLCSYFLYRYIISPFTIYDHCYKLEPGFIASYDFKLSKLKKHQYWDINKLRKDKKGIQKEYEKNINVKLSESIKKRALASDVPVHTFLSGGIDSSLISSLLSNYSKEVTAYTIEVDNEFKNELNDAKIAADYIGIELKTDKLTASKFNTLHNEVISKYDEPLGDTSTIPTYFLCQLASKTSKVALSGDGGDELFYGYNWYSKFQESKEKSFENYLRNCVRTFGTDIVNNLLSTKSALEVTNVFKAKIPEKISNENINKIDFLTFLADDILTKVDTASMANSLEVRVPFLDHKLIEYAFTIQNKFHFINNELKFLLKKVAEKYLHIDNIYKQKKGFSTPSVDWLKVDVEYNIINGYASKDNVWDKLTLKKILQNHLHEEHKWLLYNFERWYAINFHHQNKPKKKSYLKKLVNKILF